MSNRRLPFKYQSNAILSDQCVIGPHAVKATLLYNPKRSKALWILASLDSKAEWVELANRLSLPIHETDRHTLTARNGGDEAHQGILLECHPFIYTPLQKMFSAHTLVALDEVENPGNLGRSARSAWIFGANGLILPKHRSAQVGKTAEKAAVGAFARLPTAQVTNLHQALLQLTEQGFQIIGTDAEAKTPLWECDFSIPTVWVVGSEEQGLRRLTRQTCTSLVSIPTAMPESLNAADALSICLYESHKQKKLR